MVTSYVPREFCKEYLSCFMKYLRNNFTNESQQQVLFLVGTK